MNNFYREYLDAYTDLRGTHCEKVDACKKVFGRADVIPMWVADMDFRTVPEVAEVIQTRAKHAIFGYTENSAEEKAAEIAWLKRRYDLDVSSEEILYSPGVVDSIFFCVRSLTKPGDKVMIQPPVYGPFFRAVSLFDRTLVENRLIFEDGQWRMDFGLMEKQMTDGVKMMILCNPHNPVGRVWRREELQQLLDIANRYGVIVVADEIHADFNLCDHRHVRILSLDNADNCVMLTSATKSFNLAGLRQSSIIVRNEKLRSAIGDEIMRCHAGTPNIFGAIAQTTAYTHGDAWMDAVVEYIKENRDYAVKYIREHIPQIGCYPQEGTYLMWLDCRNVGHSAEEFARMLVDVAHVGLNPGTDYGEAGRGFFRLNLATQRRNVEKTLENIGQMFGA